MRWWYAACWRWRRWPCSVERRERIGRLRLLISMRPHSAARRSGRGGMGYCSTVGQHVYRFDDLRTLLARASPARSGDSLAGVAADSDEERMAARMALAYLPLSAFLHEALVPYEHDEITRLIIDSH